jgi:hypothetical protein
MGRRKRRRTRSDQGGGHPHVEREGFPTFRHGAFTPPGNYERWAAFNRAAIWNRKHPDEARARRRRAPIQLATWMIVGVAALAVVVVAGAAVLFGAAWLIRQV